MKNLHQISTYEASVYQSQAYRELKQLKAKLLKKHGLTMMQWVILGLVYDAGKNGIRISALAERLATTLAFVTNTVNSLEAMKLVIRKTETVDTRAKSVILKSGKEDLVRRIEHDLRQELKKSIYSKVSPEELQQYMNVLVKFAS